MPKQTVFHVRMLQNVVAMKLSGVDATIQYNTVIKYKNKYYYSGINPAEFRGHYNKTHTLVALYNCVSHVTMSVCGK